MPHPNPLTAEELSRLSGRNSADDLAEFSAALDGVDQEALFTRHRSALTARVWDGRSAVNGTDARTLRDALDVPGGGAVVLIDRAEDGQSATIVIQPFRPDVPGMEPIPADDAQAIGDAMADNMAAEAARGEAMTALPPELIGAPAPPDDGEPPQGGPSLEELAATVQAQAEQLSAAQETIDFLVVYLTEGA